MPNEDTPQVRLKDIRSGLPPTKLRIMQQILASPTGALSAPELSARNSINESTIQSHVSELQRRDSPLVTSLTPNVESEVPVGIPREYFAVTEYGVQLLKEIGMYDQIGLLFDIYESAELKLPNGDSRSIEEIEQYEHRPTPDWLPARASISPDRDEFIRELIGQSVLMGDTGPPRPPDGQTCERCDRCAVAGPGDIWLCEEHQKEFFRERHG